jgi:hypothetical protein
MDQLSKHTWKALMEGIEEFKILQTHYKKKFNREKLFCSSLVTQEPYVHFNILLPYECSHDLNMFSILACAFI